MKPPRLVTLAAIHRGVRLRRPLVYKSAFGGWWVHLPTGALRRLDTHAEAIAWADYHARKETP